MTKQTRLQKSEWLNWREVAKAIKVLRGERLIPTPRTLRQQTEFDELMGLISEYGQLRSDQMFDRAETLLRDVIVAQIAASSPPKG